MAPSSVLYYYRDLDEVVGDAIQHAIERFYDRRHERAEAYRDPREQLVAAIISGLPTGKDDLDVLLLYLGIPVIRRNGAIGALARSLTIRQRSLYRWILDVGAARDVFHLTDEVTTIATNLVALEDAYGLYVINGNEERTGSYIASTVSYASVSTSCDLRPILASMWDGDSTGDGTGDATRDGTGDATRDGIGEATSPADDLAIAASSGGGVADGPPE